MSTYDTTFGCSFFQQRLPLKIFIVLGRIKQNINGGLV